MQVSAALKSLIRKTPNSKRTRSLERHKRHREIPISHGVRFSKALLDRAFRRIEESKKLSAEISVLAALPLLESLQLSETAKNLELFLACRETNTHTASGARVCVCVCVLAPLCRRQHAEAQHSQPNQKDATAQRSVANLGVRTASRRTLQQHAQGRALRQIGNIQEHPYPLKVSIDTCFHHLITTIASRSSCNIITPPFTVVDAPRKHGSRAAHRNRRRPNTT